VLANFTDQDKSVQVTAKCAQATIKPAWKAEGAAINGQTVSVTVPAYNGLLLTVGGLPN